MEAANWRNIGSRGATVTGKMFNQVVNELFVRPIIGHCFSSKYDKEMLRFSVPFLIRDSKLNLQNRCFLEIKLVIMIINQLMIRTVSV